MLALPSSRPSARARARPTTREKREADTARFTRPCRASNAEEREGRIGRDRGGLCSYKSDANNFCGRRIANDNLHIDFELCLSSNFSNSKVQKMTHCDRRARRLLAYRVSAEVFPLNIRLHGNMYGRNNNDRCRLTSQKRFMIGK